MCNQITRKTFLIGRCLAASFKNYLSNKTGHGFDKNNSILIFNFYHYQTSMDTFTLTSLTTGDDPRSRVTLIG